MSKKLFFISSFLLCMFFCCSFCYSASFVDTNYNGSADKIINYFYNNYFNTSSATSEITTNYNNMISDLSNYSNIYIEYYYTAGNYSQRRINIALNNVDNGINNASQVTWNKNYKFYQVYEYLGTLRSVTNSNQTSNHAFSVMASQYNQCFNCYISNGLSYWRASDNGFFNLGDLIKLEYNDLNHGTNTINNVTCYVVRASRSVNYWRLGTLTNIDSYDNIRGRLQMYSSTNGYYDIADLTLNRSGNKFEVYVRSLDVYYNQGYRIYFNYDGNISDYYNYYFIPLNANITSGDSLVNTDIDTNNNIGLINALTNISSGDVINISNNIFTSGDSGDFSFFGVKFVDQDKWRPW